MTEPEMVIGGAENFPCILYLVLYYGDIEEGRHIWEPHKVHKVVPWRAHERVFTSLDLALQEIAADFPIEKHLDWDGKWDHTYKRTSPDPEDDRIIVWELIPDHVMRPVWHFSGWHWSRDFLNGLEDGKLPGDKDSLYGIAMEGW